MLIIDTSRKIDSFYVREIGWVNPITSRLKSKETIYPEYKTEYIQRPFEPGYTKSYMYFNNTYYDTNEIIAIRYLD